ncbi:hypothetical protein AB0C02_28110 [Micromonospora sp. NPDC048999]|uniref:hypothetical protein n=1 Tax=Micromonospora sp. NPDC048999 TaxID=3155391 RepID=UPI0033EB0E59
MAIRLPAASRNAAVDAITARLSGGTIEVRTGAQPASAGDTPTGTLLATFALNAPAFSVASGGAAALAVSPQPEAIGEAAGTAGWWRAKDGSGATVMDGSCTATGGGGDLTLNTATVSVGLALRLTGGTVTMPAG